MEKLFNVSIKTVVSLILVCSLTLGCVFAVTPAASATPADNPPVSTQELKKGSLFLKANVPNDFYDIVCVTLKNKVTEKELTLKVEGGTVFEVYIKLPDGDYEVVSAYVEKDDQYTVSSDKTEITASADSSPSILLDVQPKPAIEEEPATSEPTISETTSDTDGLNDDVTEPSESEPTVVPEESEPGEADATTTDFSVEKKEDDEDKSSSNSFRKILLDIVLSILTAVVVFAAISFIVFVVRSKMNEDQ